MYSSTAIDLERTYTSEEFMSLPDDGKRYELVRGKLVEMPGPSFRHGRIISRIIGRVFGQHLEGNPKGVVVSGAAFVLDATTNTTRIPDVAFVLKEQTIGVDENNAFPYPPHFAVEVLSPSDIWSKVIEKVAEYQLAGVRLIWVVDPFDKNVFVYRADHSKKVLTLDDELDGEDVLPGFKLPVRVLFE